MPRPVDLSIETDVPADPPSRCPTVDTRPPGLTQRIGPPASPSTPAI